MNAAHERLSDISTRWSLLFQAHEGSREAKAAAQHALLQRYCGAIYRYLLAAVRDGHVVEELCQEFALRFVRGDFRRAHPEQGRFRSLVKTSLFHLVTDYRRRQQAEPRSLPFDSGLFVAAESASGPPDQDFDRRWREELLDRAWEALAADEAKGAHSYHAVLRCRAENPEATSERLAEELSARLGKPQTAVAVRQAVHRARERFADLLLEEVARSLQTEAEDRLEEELIDLELRAYCEPALARRKNSTATG